MSRSVRSLKGVSLLRNIGLVIRASVQVMTIGGFEYLRTAGGLELETHPTWSGHLMAIFLAATAVWAAAFWFGVRRLFLIYYRTHRTFHSCRPLFDSIHRIHHRGVLPTPLDSGTISPAEFIITEMAFPLGVVVPNWSWASSQIVIAFAGHLPSHDAGTKQRFPQHHLGHHKFFTVNFGLTRAEDKRFGTLYAGE